jgi:hypothetical protein
LAKAAMATQPNAVLRWAELAKLRSLAMKECRVELGAKSASGSQPSREALVACTDGKERAAVGAKKDIPPGAQK